MPQPTSIVYTLGSTIHGQPLRLIRSVQHGQVAWSLRQDAANQRDDDAVITGIPRAVILEMAEAAKQHTS